MVRVISLDGRVFEIDEAMLRQREIASERVAGLVDRDELPDAPPAGELPVQQIPKHVLEKWMAEGIELPIPEAARGIVRVRGFPDGRLVLDIDVTAAARQANAQPPTASCSTGPNPPGRGSDCENGSCG